MHMCVCVCVNEWVNKIFIYYCKMISRILEWKSSIKNIAWKSYITITCLKSEGRSVVSDSLWPHGLYSPWNSPGQNAGVGSLSLLQGIFPTQGSKPRSPALQSDSLPTELRGKPANHKANAQARLQGSEGRVCQQVELWVQHTGQQVMEPTLRHSEGEQQLGRGAEGSSW